MKIHPASCKCRDCEADLARLFAEARAEMTAPSCPKCDILGRVFGDFARAFAGAAAMLGFEAPEDVAPAMLLAQLRQVLRRRAELETTSAQAIEVLRHVADLLDRGDVERARKEVAEVLHG